MKILSGRELAHFIKERQAHEVRSLVQANNIHPKLSIVVTIDNPVIDVYMKLKQRYGNDLGIEVEVHRFDQKEVPTKLSELNADPSVHGIIIQLPLQDPEETDRLVGLVSPDKDVDGLGPKANFDPATPMAILWLLAGYNINLLDKKVLLIGKGKLVGIPLQKMLKNSGVNVSVADRSTEDLKEICLDSDVIITATGSPAILSSDMIKNSAIIVDAGVASEDGKTVGDVEDSVYERDDITLTPKKGGVGPLTVCALFENVIVSARRSVKTDQ
ncbi:MAG TPA: bifunctional 5,10-methylenetetrahydrofolate dehydrogenase/5,10-methenyltetrahydrofolate cyclohydrolase [Candidatus Saccharimonadales bacterium]